MIFGNWGIELLYGKNYAAAGMPLKIITWYTAFAYLGVARNAWIVSEEKQKYLTIINVCGAMANVTLNFFLIPLCGAIGAAIASVITEFTTNFIIGFILKPIHRNNYLMVKALNPKITINLINSLLKRYKEKKI
jgi:O-antigen/teichoic acid export membrane protein